MRRAVLSVALTLVLAGGAAAQAPAPRVVRETPGIVRYGKWGAAALFLGLTAAGLVEHHRADNAFSELREYCFDTASCAIGPDGRYPDAGAEALYLRVVQGDRNARGLFISGQVALAGTAALFIVEFMKDRATENIPLSHLKVAPTRDGVLVGWSLAF